MKNDPAVQLIKVREGIASKMALEIAKANKVKAAYEAHQLIITEYKRQIESVEYSIRSIRGDNWAQSESDPIQSALVGIMATNPPLSYAELTKMLEDRGLPGGGIRKSLRGIAFRMVGSDPAKYTLRDKME